MRKIDSTFLLLSLSLGSGGCQVYSPASPEQLLSDPEPVVVDDSIYLLSRASGSVVRVTPGEQGETAYTNQEDARIDTIHVGRSPQHMVLTPDHQKMLVLNHESNRDELYVVDLKGACNGESPLDTGCVTALEAAPLHDTLVISPDSRFVLSYISPASANTSTAEVVNLNEVGVYDLQTNTARFTALGFNPKGFAFTSISATPSVVAITASKVIALDLTTGETVPRDLTLSTDTKLEPQQVVLTGDEKSALVTLQGSADLYTFDLTQPTLPINILSLSHAPETMTRSSSGDQTLVLADNGYELNVIDNSSFAIDVYALQQPADRILTAPGASWAALYDSSGTGRYLYYVDLEKGRVQPYLLDNPCHDVKMSPDGDALVIFYVPESYGDSNYSDAGLDGSNAVAILNLAQNDRQPNPILVASYPTGAAFYQGVSSDQNSVFVPFEGEEHGLVARFNLSTYASSSVEIPPHPRVIGMLESDGRVVVVHDSANGMISVFPQDDPDRVQFIAGFMATSLF